MFQRCSHLVAEYWTNQQYKFQYWNIEKTNQFSMAEKYDTICFICNANYKQVQTLLGSKTTWLALEAERLFRLVFLLIHRRPTCLWTIWLHSLGYFLAMVDITFWICFFLHSSHGGGQIPLRISGAIPKKTIWKLFKLTY